MRSVPIDFQAEEEKSRGRAPSPPEDVQDERIARIRNSLEEHGLDAVLMFSDGSHPDNIRHLAGYVHVFHYAYSLLLIPREDPPVLLIDQPWHLEEAEKMSWIEDVRPLPPRGGSFPDLVSGLEEAFGDANLETATVGTLETFLPEKCVSALEAAVPNVEFVDGSPVWADYVTSPSDYDRKMVERTAAIADEGLATVKAEAAAGKTEREVCLAAYERMAELGAEFLHECANDTHVNIGSFSDAISNVRPYLFTNNRLEHGQMFWVDLTAQYNGYHIDTDRTICIGEPTEEQRELYDVTAETYEAMEDALRPGLPAEEIWNIGYEIAESYGYEDNVNFIYMGHSTGIETSERPYALAGDDREVRSGSFYNLEPGIYVPGVGSACIENTLYVSDSGVESVTKLDEGLHIV